MADTTGRRLILKDKTTVEDGVAGFADGFLWLYFTGYTIAEAAAVFADPNKTGIIVFQYGNMKDRYEGFTNCKTVQMNGDGKISVCMTKP